jgi:NADP-dependent 3-hydroxy acid dehydrogenase YdfG
MTTPPRAVRAIEIGSKQFSAQDQELFASLSFDRNPMHMDPIAARRLLTGHPVVHGIHVLLTALEYWVNEHALTPTFLDCSFNNAINIEDIVAFKQRNQGDGLFLIEASVNGLLCAKLRITASTSASPPRGSVVRAHPNAARDDSFLERVGTPLDEPPVHHLNQQYLVPVDTVDLNAHFPRACHHLGSSRTAGLLALSYFVGMVCPGLNSIFSTVSLKLDESTPDTESIRFSVDQYDERFRLFHVSLEGTLSGRLTAFLRPSPQQQLTMAEVSEKVTPREFEGTRSLVIGASRGLGEMAAKILAAGGGKVTISYAQGLTDIETVNADINASGSGASDVLKLDVTSGNFGAIDFESLDAIYFFATPRIGRKKAGVFDSTLFNEFISFYVESLYKLCLHIEATALTRKMRIYVPSSVFIAERPDGMAEYAMAKAAAEVMIEDINRSFRKVSIVATRLPKLSTDQTSSVLKESTGDNLDTLLPVIRVMTR